MESKVLPLVATQQSKICILYTGCWRVSYIVMIGSGVPNRVLSKGFSLGQNLGQRKLPCVLAHAPFVGTTCASL